MDQIPACVVPAGDACGEGPVWHASEQALYWTDINRFLIHRFDSRGQSVRTWLFDEPVTALTLTDRDDTLAVCLGSGLILWKPASGERGDHGFRLAGFPAVRLNDGRPDPRGSLWVGSMRNNVNADGSSVECTGTDGVLFRIDPNGAVTEWKRGIGVSNTLAWSPANDRFYFCDSLANVVWMYSYNAGSGAIGNEQPFFAGFDRGFPDGSATDSEGFLWNCRYAGKCVVRVSPEGRVDRILEMPVENITSCTFGGPDLRTLYITTASGAAHHERFAGGLFAVRTDVPGLAENKFHLSR